MKKNLFYYLFAVICSVTLFTACSDDDEDTTWQQIPEITNDNVTLKLNENTPAGATATLDIINAESAKVTLKNVIFGHPTVDVNVTLQKKDDTSYNFSGTTNLEPARAEAVNSALKVTVTGTVTTAGKVTVDVTTSGWAAVNGVYANDSLAITMDGKKQNNDSQYAVTLTATENGTAATLVFKKIVNVALNVEANVSLANGQISGTVEPLLGYTITIAGSVANGKLTLDLVSSGYGTIADTYSASNNTITFNGSASKSGSVGIKVLSEKKAQVALSGMLVGERTATIEDAVITKEDGKEIYNLTGKVENGDYVVNFKGTVGEDRKLTAEVSYAVMGDIVGKWNIMKQVATGQATPIFNFSTGTGSVTMPASLLAIIPDNMKPMIPATMPDAQFAQLVQGLLASYAVYLQSIEFSPEGRVVATYIEMPKDTNGDGKIDAQDGNDMTPKTFGMLQYYMKDSQLYLTVSLEELMGMLPMSAPRAWDPSGVLIEGIPVGHQVTGNVLSVSLVTDVVVGLAGFAQGMLPIIGMMLPEETKPQFDMIQAIFDDIMTGVIPDVKELEVGLMFTK